MNKRYTVEQEEFLKNQDLNITDKELTVIFNAKFGTSLHTNSISQKRRRLNISKTRGRKVKDKTEEREVVQGEVVVNQTTDGINV